MRGGLIAVPVLGVVTVMSLLAAPAQQSTFRAGARTVALYATVQDAEGRLVPDLKREHFQVFDDGTPVELSVFSNDIQLMTLVLLLDMSISIENEFTRVREAVRHFVDQLLPGDRVRIGTFGAEVALSPWLTGDKALLRRVLAEELWPGGNVTPLYAALDAGMASLATEPGRRVLLAVTDGIDSSSSLRERKVVPLQIDRRAVEGEFLVYAIGLQGPGLRGGITALADQTGGGRFELKRNADLATTMARVVDELHHQYVLGFVPATLDGRTHRLEVRMTQPKLTARARQSYIARASP